MRKRTSKANRLKTIAAEQFRTLRTNIQFSSLGNEIKSIVITSSMPGEGKSIVTSNLAVTIANTGKKVIIVDCDLRKPTIHKKFSLPNLIGLTNILVQDRNKLETITAANYPNLFILTSGPIPPNPSELLGSNNMRELLNELINTYDIVLLDSPPVLYITDTQILSAIAQGTILVTAYGKSEKAAVLSAKENIQKVGGKILGVVINKMPIKKNDTYYEY